MEKVSNECGFFGAASIGKILLRVAPPVMPAQLIQALHNIVDSFFVGKYPDDALTALSVVYPWQLIAIALAVGTGVGVNTYIARKFAHRDEKAAYAAAFWAMSFIGLNFTRIAFPFAETAAGAVGLALYFRTVKGRKKSEAQINQSAEPQAEGQTPSGKGEENG